MIVILWDVIEENKSCKSMHHSTCKMTVPVNQYREKDRLFVELHFILDFD